MAKPIEVDDLEVGMRVTVLEWHEQERDIYGDGFGMVATATRKFRDGSWVGDVMEILAIDAPFVAVRHQNFDHAIELDTRRLRLAKLSDEYVKAMERPARSRR